jgi:hypothetical protein
MEHLAVSAMLQTGFFPLKLIAWPPYRIRLVCKTVTEAESKEKHGAWSHMLELLTTLSKQWTSFYPV